LIGATVKLSSAATPLYWDIDGSTAGLQAGAGNWATSGGGGNLRWSTAATGTALLNWTNGDSAFFETSGSSLINVATLNMTVDSMTFDGTGYTLTAGSGSLVLLGAGNITTNADAVINAPLGGSVGLTKLGSSNLTLGAVDSYTGATTISAGTLTIDNNNMTSTRLVNTNNITVNSGTSLVLTQNAGTTSTDRINNSATISLAGGTFKLNGVSEGTAGSAGLGALSLTSSSTINLSNTSLLHFAASNLQSWSGTLSIYNWSGTPLTGGGAEQLLFGSNSSALTAAQLSHFQFYSDAGVTPYSPGAMILSTGEVVPDPVPEPRTWALVSFGLVVLAYGWRRSAMRQWFGQE
jgi:autotransporter-associated beta strand protein